MNKAMFEDLPELLNDERILLPKIFLTTEKSRKWAGVPTDKL